MRLGKVQHHQRANQKPSNDVLYKILYKIKYYIKSELISQNIFKQGFEAIYTQRLEKRNIV